MKMKKILFVFLAVFTMLFVACGKKAPTDDAAQQAVAGEANQDFHIGIVTPSVSHVVLKRQLKNMEMYKMEEKLQ